MTQSRWVLLGIHAAVLAAWIPVNMWAKDEVVIPVSLPPARSAESAWQVLSEGVASPKTSQRADALAALATITGNPRAIQLVSGSLKDSDTQIRKLAAEELEKMRATSAINALKDALEGNSDEVSFAVAHALLQLGDSTGRRIMLDILSGKRSASPGFLQSQERKIQQKIHDPVGVGTFAAEEGAGVVMPGAGFGLRVIDGLARDHTSLSRIAAAKALASDHSPEAIRELEAALEDGNPVIRAAAAEALGEQKVNWNLMARLRAHLHDSNSAVRDMAAASIIRMSEADS